MRSRWLHTSPKIHHNTASVVKHASDVRESSFRMMAGFCRLLLEQNFGPGSQLPGSWPRIHEEIVKSALREGGSSGQHSKKQTLLLSPFEVVADDAYDAH